MGTETAKYIIMTTLNIRPCEVKLNNPQMGTETFA